jgi:mannan endo-1,4-beta-mannosidase
MVGGALVGAYALDTPSSASAVAVETDLSKRDPHATSSAVAVYRMLTGLENRARSGVSSQTIIGQHVELQNELYNADYGDYLGVKPPGYYYRKAADITGRLPGFLEVDLGPGYGEQGWGVGRPRTYSRAVWPTCRPSWGYTDDVVDLSVGVWRGLPRPADGSYNPGGTEPRCDGSASALPGNGGAPAGLVGMSFHQPWPGSPTKAYAQTLHSSSPAAHDARWIERVLTPGSTEHQALIQDLSFLADHLTYLASCDVPVLLRPFHEMNAIDTRTGFWWTAASPEQYRRLWGMTYDYLVGSRGLHNLLFTWAPLAWDGVGGRDPWAYYPGDSQVDLVGVDDYSDSPEHPFEGGAWTAKWYKDLARYRKPRVLAESFYVPISKAQPKTLDRSPWVMWTVWGQALTKNNASPNVKQTYSSSRVLTGGHGSAVMALLRS